MRPSRECDGVGRGSADMPVTIGAFTGLSLIVAILATWAESTVDGHGLAVPHRWGPWVAVAAGLVALAVVS